MKRRKGFVSIEVMLVSLICSMIVTILMDNSFQRRKELDRSFKIIGSNIDKNNSEEQFLKYMLKENILNIENINKLDFTLNNMNATYIEDKKAMHIKSKDKRSF
ncbi:type IV pilin [Clostridium perfringens]|uniref:type IV pilin n=1 Tax=Clostridium perfringens TaxID=1502 RepID=UPI002FCD0C6A